MYHIGLYKSKVQQSLKVQTPLASSSTYTGLLLVLVKTNLCGVMSVTLTTSLFSFYQVWFPLVSQFQSKFQEMKGTCHITGHACSDHQQWLLQQDCMGHQSMTYTYFTAWMWKRTWNWLHCSERIWRNYSLLFARKCSNQNSGDEQDRSLSALPNEGF